MVISSPPKKPVDEKSRSGPVRPKSGVTSSTSKDKAPAGTPQYAGTGNGGGVDNKVAERVQEQSNAEVAKTTGGAIKPGNAGELRVPTPASAKTGTKADVSTNGAADLSSGNLSSLASDLAKLQGNTPTTNAEIAQIATSSYAEGEKAQVASDQAAAAKSGATTTTAAPATSSTSTLTKIQTFFSSTTGKVVIVAAIGVGGFVVYRRIRNGGMS